jgi:hypothetical protein
MEASRGPPRVKNKAAAAVQISAEQLLREAVDRQDEKLKAPTQRFADIEELHEYVDFVYQLRVRRILTLLGSKGESERNSRTMCGGTGST